jgi:transcription initiation factor TFIIH subunit 4
MSENGRGVPGLRSSGQQDGAPTILTHLLTLPAQTLQRLYSYPSNTLSIFRLLPPIARHLIFTMLFLPDPPQMASADLAALLTRDSLKDEPSSSNRRSRSSRGLDEAKDILSSLRILRESQGTGIVNLNKTWTDSLRRALVGGGDHKSFGVPSKRPAETRLNARQLDDFALRSWESILLYMVASADARTPSYPVLFLLRTAGLMQPEDMPNSKGREDLTKMSITSAGFQFLLEDVSAQLWLLLHTYLITLSDTTSSNTQESTSADIVEHMTFLFTLSSATLGQDYDIASLTPAQKEMLVFFRDLGLIYQKTENSASFNPTRLVTTLTNSSQLPLQGSNQNSEEERGFVILETNYKVYAYTSEY